MWTIVIFVLCTLLAPRIQGQTFGNLEEPREYMAAVVDALWTKIKDHGLSNLAVLDATVPYNFTAFGVELHGSISFEDGFVQDIGLVNLSSLNFQFGAPLTHAHITGRVAFENLRLYRDFRADLTTGMKVGTVVSTPTSFFYSLNIQKEHGNDTVVPTLTFDTYTNLVSDFNPDNTETRLIRRQLQSQTNNAPIQPELVSTTAEAWIPLFTNFLNDIVMEIEFPAITF